MRRYVKKGGCVQIYVRLRKAEREKEIKLIDVGGNREIVWIKINVSVYVGREREREREK